MQRAFKHRIDNSLRLLALEDNWILCAIVIAVNAIWHSGMLLIVRYVLTVLCMLSLNIRVERARFCQSRSLQLPFNFLLSLLVI